MSAIAPKIGINGFGRIGRMALRAALKMTDVSVNFINDPFIDGDYMVYMLKYDSVHGTLKNDISFNAAKGCLIIDGHEIHTSAIREAKDIAWKNCNIVLECTGINTTIPKAQVHIHDEVKVCIISAPSADAPMFVMGVNNMTYVPQITPVLSNASCTTNCLAPICHVLLKEFGIVQALMTTVHASTATQPSVDGPSKKDWRGGRSCMSNIIPASTGAAAAVGKVVNGLNGKITGMAFRVPVADVSVIDLTVELEKETTYERICETMKKYSQGELAGVLDYCDQPLVSSDFIGNTHVSIFDAKAGIMLNSRFVKIISWYDNETGYATKLVELARYVASTWK